MDTRTEINSILMNSPSKMKEAKDKINLLKNCKELLYLKRDQAVFRLGDFVSSIHKHVEQMHKEMEMELIAKSKSKELAIQKSISDMEAFIKRNATDITQAEELLEKGQEENLFRRGPDLIKQLHQQLFTKSKDFCLENETSLFHLLFVHNPAIFTEAMENKFCLGHVEDVFGLDAAAVTVRGMNGTWSRKVGVGVKEKLLLQVSNTHVEEARKNLLVEIFTPSGEPVKVDVLDNNNGRFLVTFTSAVSGVHVLKVKLFGAAAGDSPYHFLVWDAETRERKPRTATASLFQIAMQQVSDNPPVIDRIEPTPRAPSEPPCHRGEPAQYKPYRRREETAGMQQGIYPAGPRVTAGTVTVDKASPARELTVKADSPPLPVGRSDGNNNKAVVQHEFIKPALPVTEKFIRQEGKSLKAEFVRKVGRKGFQDDCLQFPIGVTVSPNKDVIVCNHGNNIVNVFHWEGRIKFCIGTAGGSLFRRPSAVVCNSDGDIFIKDDCQVQVFDKNGKFIRKFGKGSLIKPYGLVINVHGHLMLVDQLPGEVASILTYDQLGNFILRMPYISPGPCDWSWSKCRFLHAYNDDDLFIVDLGLNCIYHTDHLGRERGVVGNGRGKFLGQFNQPAGITGDSLGNLLVADSKNNRVQVISAKGEFHGTVDFTSGFDRPSGLFLTRDNYLCVVSLLEHNVNIYRLFVDSDD